MKTTTKARRSSIWMTVAMSVLFMSARSAGAQDLFNDTNVYGVTNGPTNQPLFWVTTSARVSQLVTYHWNYGRGKVPGTIALRNTNGQVFGPFAASGSSGQSGAPNVNWTANVNVTIPAGTYTVVDSDPSTWSQNQQSSSRGFAIVRGSLVQPSSTPTPTTTTTPTTPTNTVPYGGNCHGAGCTHPDYRSVGGNGPFGVGMPHSVHVSFNPQNFYWIVYNPPYTALSTLQQQCSAIRPIAGHLVLLDDEPYYYYFIGVYSRFGCER